MQLPKENERSCMYVLFNSKSLLVGDTGLGIPVCIVNQCIEGLVKPLGCKYLESSSVHGDMKS